VFQNNTLIAFRIGTILILGGLQEIFLKRVHPQETQLHGPDSQSSPTKIFMTSYIVHFRPIHKKQDLSDSKKLVLIEIFLTQDQIGSRLFCCDEFGIDH
jgi:hypothetical protein